MGLTAQTQRKNAPPAAPPTGTGITANGALSTTNYCVVAQNGSWYAWKHGPGGVISVSTDKNAICT